MSLFIKRSLFLMVAAMILSSGAQASNVSTLLTAAPLQCDCGK